jgi:hypothetical protein
LAENGAWNKVFNAMRVTIHIYTLSFILLLAYPMFSQADFTESVEVVTVRPGVTQSYLLLMPENPVATVVLFAGYGGYLDITSDGIQQPSQNFLVRTREMFAKKNFNTVVVDVPSDFSGVDGILGWRATQTHAQDLQKIITKLREASDVPVWLIGTSRGTISAANAAARLQVGGPDGLVLTASVYLGDVELDKIRIPTLIIHHEEDDCSASDFYAAKRLPAELKNVSRIEFIAFLGGRSPESGACDPLSEHGFFGLEEKVINTISSWIENKTGQ